MPLAAGQTLTHYEILGSLGAGAMGEVYRARDTRLGRDVALKVLPEAMAGDEERLRRFEREARALASLSHPNVAQVYGIDQVDSVCFMAMELVPGDDLAARLSRGALPLGEALQVCRQIAAGLEAAHEAGVIHRDLKPSNVICAPGGDVKVLDFGLAKPTGPGPERGSTTDSVLSTEEGRLLGTPTYMSPEQARGRPIDRRVDVWAFGCVLYECLTGRRAFAGETLGDVLASVLEKDPDLSALPRATPARVRELLERCLRKDPRRRLRDVGDARIAIEDLGSLDESSIAAPSGAGARRPVLVAVGVLLVAALAFGLGRGRRSASAPTRYVSRPLTADNHCNLEPAWSPEGEWLAFGRMAGSSEDFYLRHVSSGDETLRRSGPGDESAFSWSPDGQYIAFVASDLPGTPVLVMSPYSTGGERRLTETNIRVFDSLLYGYALGDRAWSPDSTSLLAARMTAAGQSAIWRVGLHDGSEEQLTFPPPGLDDMCASHSFAGDRIVFMRRGTKSSRLMLMPAAGGDPTELIFDPELMEGPAWRPDDERILYCFDGGIWQVSIDEPVPEPLTSAVGHWVGGMSVSASGRIAYSVTTHDTILTALDLDSHESVPLTSHAMTNVGPRVSPDGRSLAYTSDRTGNMEIWVLDLDGLEHQITQSPGDDVYPDWSPDGERLVFVSARTGSPQIFVADRDGGNCRALDDQKGIATDIAGVRDSMSVRWSPASPAGELIGFIVASDEGRDLWGIPPDGSRPAEKLLESVTSFDWYLDSHHVVYTLDRGRAEELVVADLETGESRVLWTGPHAELDVAPDGSAVMFCSGLGHLNMGLATLELVPSAEPGGLPTARGEPVEIVRPERGWHVHHGGWGPDSRSVVYVHDEDRGNLWELVEEP